MKIETGIVPWKIAYVISRNIFWEKFGRLARKITKLYFILDFS